jgi:phosphoribosyl-ATP pyrophosphohydrolase/phosphoribosyl-AMP cyclohydrolase
VSSNNFEFLAVLETVIRERLANPDSSSYTAALAASGTQRIAQKVGEEGVELALAAVGGKRDEVIDEAADLIYHLLVLLQTQELELADVVARLEERHSKQS